MFQLLYADEKGRMFEHPEFLASGRTGNFFTEIDETDVIPLPEGASLVMVPGGSPIGVDSKGSFAVHSGERGKPVYAVGALLPQGFSRTLIPAYRRQEKVPLPLFGYAAVGWRNGGIYVAAVQTDETNKWNPAHYSTSELASLVLEKAAHYKDNRIIDQLSKCALQYHCFTAQNIFYQRWEGGIPVSPVCNARCLGCISQQPAECCPSPQSRIDFTPTVKEITEVAVPHLVSAEDGIVSFGQGCEGEPSLAAPRVAEAILEIRRQTTGGTINMNTNAGFTEGIKALCQAGIDSFRVSTISARAATYQAYYAPRDYTWENVQASVKAARDQGIFVSLNLLTYPGLTDTIEEIEAMLDFIEKYDINMVQIRNLNIDPDYFADKIPLDGGEVLGISRFIEILQTERPGLIVGNYSKPVIK
ncbi:MAG: radical SAM protein [Thermincola sp.]|jgi:pyruvate-formate lyase-activating enzyme|nr:radical SAM protein [Thermincola sp.]MDT3703511.1 radical SAM protein [Thermincola sp.]